MQILQPARLPIPGGASALGTGPRKLRAFDGDIQNGIERDRDASQHDLISPFARGRDHRPRYASGSR